MNMPTHIRTKPNQVAILAWVVLQTGVVLAADADFSILRTPGICGTAVGRDAIADRRGEVHRLDGPNRPGTPASNRMNAKSPASAGDDDRADDDVR